MNCQMLKLLDPKGKAAPSSSNCFLKLYMAPPTDMTPSPWPSKSPMPKDMEKGQGMRRQPSGKPRTTNLPPTNSTLEMVLLSNPVRT